MMSDRQERTNRGSFDSCCFFSSKSSDVASCCSLLFDNCDDVGDDVGLEGSLVVDCCRRQKLSQSVSSLRRQEEASQMKEALDPERIQDRPWIRKDCCFCCSRSLEKRP
jgi:hypothetical protein